MNIKISDVKFEDGYFVGGVDLETEDGSYSCGFQYSTKEEGRFELVKYSETGWLTGSCYEISVTKEILEQFEEVHTMVEEYVNENYKDADHEIVQCGICHKYSFWGGHEDDPTMWYCERCGKVFCNDCVKVNNEEDEFILCDKCR